MTLNEQIETAPFTIEVPFKLIKTGAADKLIVYLHGYKQNIAYFEKKFSPFLSIDAFHLFIQGPYPIYDEKHRRNVEQWGRAWYLYDGRQEQFSQSLEKSSKFIENVIMQATSDKEIQRCAILGYSMGGYLAGHFALSRSNLVDDLAVIGGRIKTEYFINQSYNNLNVLALHGNKDQSVSNKRAKDSAEELRTLGASVHYSMIEEGHRLSAAYIDKAKEWFLQQGYVQRETENEV